MRKIALYMLLCAPALALAQTQISGSAVQIGGNVPGASALTTNGRSGNSSLSGSTINVPSNLGGNVFALPNFASLVGAFTDSSGNVIQPIAIGNGPVTFPVPVGATQLQLGVNDPDLVDGGGSWVISVNGTHYTVPGTTAPWVHTAGINALYPTDTVSTTAPIVAAIGAAGTPVTIQYVSGTITDGAICGGVGTGPFDASGQANCALTSNTGLTLPGFWTQTAASAAAGAAVWGSITGTLSSQTDLNTALGLKAPLASPTFTGTPAAPTAAPGTNTTQLATTAFVLANAGSGTVSGQANNVVPLATGSTTIGAQSHLNESTAGADTFTQKVVVNDGSGNAGAFQATIGTDPGGAAGTATYTTDATNGYAEVHEGTGSLSRICTAANGVCTGGGASYTNVTGSTTQTTVAAINTLCGSGTLYATTALSIATGGTVSCPVQFSKSGVWTVATGQTVTFTYQVTTTDTAPLQHFIGPGVVVLPAQDAPVEWWGAVADGAYPAGTGTDNAAAINACITSLTAGRCLLVGNAKYRVASAISITKSWVGIAGPNENANTIISSVVGVCVSTCILTDQAGIDIVDVHGTSTATYISGNMLQNFQVARTVLPTGSAAGFSLQFTGGLKVNNTQSFDSIRDYDLQANGHFGVGLISNSQAGHALAYGATTLYGWYLNGQGETTQLFHDTYADNATGASRITWGFYCTSCVDYRVDQPEVGGASHGIGFTGSIQNALFTNSSLDTLSVDCINAQSVSGTVAIAVQGGECNSTGTYGADFESVGPNFMLQGMRFLLAGTTAAIYVHNSNIGVQNNEIRMRNNAGSVGVLLDGSLFATISGNQVDNSAGSTTSIPFKFINTSSANNFLGNKAKSTSVVSTGAFASFDATSCNNVAYDMSNQFTTGEFGAVVDSCGNNAFTPVTPSGAMIQLAQTVVAGSTTSTVTFNSIPAGYTSLVVRYFGRTDTPSVAPVDLACIFNNDSSALYDRAYGQWGQSGSNTISSGITTAQTSMACLSSNGASAPANTMSSGAFYVDGYANTTFYKSAMSESEYAFSATIGQIEKLHNGFQYRSTAAITRIDITVPSSNHFVAGSTLTLYGIK